MATRKKTTASHDPAPTAKRATRRTTSDPSEPPRDGTGLFEHLPDDVILSCIVPLLSFSASVALERCNKRLRGVLLRNKRTRCNTWLVRDVLGISEDACAPVLAELASVGKAEGSMGVFYFSSAEGGDPAFLEETSTLAEAVVALAERELSTKKDGCLENLDQTPYGKGYWVGDSDEDEDEDDDEDEADGEGEEKDRTAPKTGAKSGCVCCALQTARAPPHEVERCKRHTSNLYETNAVFRLVVLRRVWAEHDNFDTLHVADEKTWLADYHSVWRGNHRSEISGALAEIDDNKDYAKMLGFEPTRFLHGMHCGGGYAGELFCGVALGNRIPKKEEPKKRGAKR